MKIAKRTSVLISLMLLTSLFVGLGFVSQAVATTTNVHPGESIQDAIFAATDGDILLVEDGYYVGNININRSITLRSENGSDVTWINGSVNITADDVSLGVLSATSGFTIYQATTSTSGINAVNVSTNGSSNNIDIYFNEIIGGYNGIQIGGGAGETTNSAVDIWIYSNTIRDNGASAIRAQSVFFNDSYIYANQISNTSNAATAAAILIDGPCNTDIVTNTIQDTYTHGGEGINITGLSHPCDDVTLQWNVIYDTWGYSPIIIRSLSDTEYVQNMRIIGNDLDNGSNIYSEPGIRFDNISGRITATNISAFFNSINTSSRDIEERFALTAAYDEWTGVMPAYFNWYGAATTGTFRDSTHLYATPYLLSSNAYDDIVPFGYYEFTGAETHTINNTFDADTIIAGGSTDDMVAVVYPYPISLLSSYPTRSMHKYVEIGVTNMSRIDFPVNITVYYTTADLETRGWSERYIRGLVFYNETSGEWEQFNNTDCNTANQWGGYAGYVWALVYEPTSGTVIGIDYNRIVPEEEEEEGVVTVKDTDGDGLPDDMEKTLGTNPNLADTDFDGFSDYDEYIAGSDPLDASSTPAMMPVLLGLPFYLWIIIVLVIVILVVLLVILSNKKLRRRYFKM